MILMLAEWAVERPRKEPILYKGKTSSILDILWYEVKKKYSNGYYQTVEKIKTRDSGVMRSHRCFLEEKRSGERTVGGRRGKEETEKRVSGEGLSTEP